MASDPLPDGNPVHSTEQNDDAAVEASHYLVQCDECGEDPIVGVRYKSLLR